MSRGYRVFLKYLYINDLDYYVIKSCLQSKQRLIDEYMPEKDRKSSVGMKTEFKTGSLIKFWLLYILFGKNVSEIIKITKCDRKYSISIGMNGKCCLHRKQLLIAE